LLATFFPDNASAAVAAIIDIAADKLTPEEIEEIQRKINLSKNK
jgi:hypothetical protein